MVRVLVDGVVVVRWAVEAVLHLVPVTRPDHHTVGLHEHAGMAEGPSPQAHKDNTVAREEGKESRSKEGRESKGSTVV
ncbi:hypothetical protein Pmani_026859 [Petrolisthes manimaculis]|uniref:Uncharacterized protein n=1 Tax=Petrolisthes manimaculis TaxID=1843537 RepID=A0AAE1P519_9EUCA|nr:hypothetical protein Pmani_026859 [Petrolisthes manimaculis]